MMVKGFSPVILASDKREAAVAGGVDLARDERLRRCQSCREGFNAIKIQLEDLKRSPGYVGVAVRDCLKEMSNF